MIGLFEIAFGAGSTSTIEDVELSDWLLTPRDENEKILVYKPWTGVRAYVSWAISTFEDAEIGVGYLIPQVENEGMVVQQAQARVRASCSVVNGIQLRA